MVGVSFFGSLIAAFCGISPGNIFVSMLVIIGTDPVVASATGMYITMFTTLAASIQVFIFNKINLKYALSIQIMTFLGTFPGIYS